MVDNDMNILTKMVKKKVYIKGGMKTVDKNIIFTKRKKKKKKRKGKMKKIRKKKRKKKRK